MTDPGSPLEVPEADRAEQEELVEPPDVVLATEATPPPEDVPEADALEQQLVAQPRGIGSGQPQPIGDREADDADVLEQEADVPVVEDDDLP
ncbi:hypothetical protein [Geodermatophilus ruber]|uniref:Uncharacterized protein n=1 Tax=Geodermatophilus ruber TaxID=504800 RepID=A0A1I4BYW8_9ACTN|nr:hypothetical protein [Geodermatophilus ruber]SFK73111.1 hypothetical protein SAMN04488085_103233 [Geodermatophilus ruber]